MNKKGTVPEGVDKVIDGWPKIKIL